MSTESAQVMTKNQRMAVVAAIICFLVGWFHTGQGLENYRILGSQYGGFFVATGVLLIMVLAYRGAVKGSLTALGIYILCATITFLCNLNSFYPSYRADSLIREELRQHRTEFGTLRESIKTLFQDVQLEAFAKSVRNKSEQLQAQIRQRGFGALAEDDLKHIEDLLGSSITRLRLGSTQEDWDRCAVQYAKIIDDELNAKLKENRYLDKIEDISHAEQYYVLYSKKIDETLAEKAELKQVPDYVEELIKGYRDSCKKARMLLEDEAKSKEGTAGRKAAILDCDENYSSPNLGLGTFSHTFKSVWATKTDGGTIAVVLIALFIDFLLPLALYFLVRAETRNSRDDEFWTAGGKKVGPSIRT